MTATPLDLFASEYEPIGSVGLAAMAYAGMSASDRRTSVVDILEAATAEKKVVFMSLPGRHHEVRAFYDLRIAKTAFRCAASEDKRLMSNARKIKGLWAAKFVEEMAPGGYLDKYPHLIGEQAAKFARFAK